MKLNDVLSVAVAAAMTVLMVYLIGSYHTPRCAIGSVEELFTECVRAR